MKEKESTSPARPGLLSKITRPASWRLSLVWTVVLIVGIFVLGGLGGYYYQRRHVPDSRQILGEEENIYINFLFEIYDKIQANHWQKIPDEKLVNLYVLGIEKLTGQPQSLDKKTPENLQTLLKDVLAQIDKEEKKEEFTAQLADIVLANLQPFGRSRLYSQQDKEQLEKTVKNQTDEDHYKSLGVDKEASQAEIAAAYEKQTQQLKEEAETSKEAQKKLSQVNEARQVLGDEDARALYDQAGVEPTMSYELIRPSVFHIHINKFSPTTVDELQRVTQKMAGEPGVDTLVLDLRGNIGGAIDGLPYFLGPFIGKDQYAYQFLHQEERKDYKTKVGWLPSLVQYKKVVVLVDENAQSSAEIMASVLKKYNVGVLVGNTTRGWGTVEKVFQLDNQLGEGEKYSMFLVHSLTLRADGQPIEGNGVEPDVFITDDNWQEQLSAYLPDDTLVEAVAELVEEEVDNEEVLTPQEETDENEETVEPDKKETSAPEMAPTIPADDSLGPNLPSAR